MNDSCNTCNTCSTCLTQKEMGVLFEIANLISDSKGDIVSALEKSLLALKNSLNLENCVIYKLEDEVLNIFASISLSKHQRNAAQYRLGEGATGQAIQSKEPVVIENIHNDLLFLNKTGNANSDTISYVAVPMIVENKVIGALATNLMKSTEMDFDETVRILSIVSTLFGQSIQSHAIIESEKERLNELKLYYKVEWDAKVHNFGDIIGDSPQMKQVYNVIERIASSDVTILVRGETGTGKELVASAIHKRSKRKDEPFIKLNCAAITDTLLESELFGHEKGAFTDAKETRKGRFELADGGTLFLDEIGDISASAQVKLLRVLQEREFERVGGSKTIKVNVRLVAATNRDLEQMVKDGEFREDLYYRLNVIPIDTPPLRERGEDIKLLVNFFLEKSRKNHKKDVVIHDDAMEELMAYPWPGNVRELENTIERIVLMGSDDGITADDMAFMIPAYKKEKAEKLAENTSSDMSGKTLEEIEQEAIQNALKQCDGNHAEAAKLLGITPRQIRYKAKNMHDNLIYKGEDQQLVEDFIDIGYMAENVEVLSISKEQVELKRSHADKSMTLFISFPSSQIFLDEILKIDELMSKIQVDINCYLIFDKFHEAEVNLQSKLKKFEVYFDEEEEFGNMYGTRIEYGTLKDRLTKALFLISKDGAVFYLDMPQNLEDSLDFDRLHVELNKAYVSYTGVGCHG